MQSYIILHGIRLVDGREQEHSPHVPPFPVPGINHPLGKGFHGARGESVVVAVGLVVPVQVGEHDPVVSRSLPFTR